MTERTAFRVTRINPTDRSKQVAVVIDTTSISRWSRMGCSVSSCIPICWRGKGRDYVFVAFTYDRDPGPELDRRLRLRRYSYDAASQTLHSPFDVIDGLSAHDDHGGFATIARTAI